LWRDEPLLLDMLLAASDARSFVETLDQPQFNDSKLHQAAVIRCLEIIGEAAAKVSREFRDAHPDIEWREITGMRHRLIHNYADVRLDVVWDVLQDKLPRLIADLQPLVPPADDNA
jgi:uncharacterized protein with HEPN domain